MCDNALQNLPAEKIEVPGSFEPPNLEYLMTSASCYCNCRSYQKRSYRRIFWLPALPIHLLHLFFQHPTQISGKCMFGKVR